MADRAGGGYRLTPAAIPEQEQGIDRNKYFSSSAYLAIWMSIGVWASMQLVRYLSVRLAGLGCIQFGGYSVVSRK